MLQIVIGVALVAIGVLCLWRGRQESRAAKADIHRYGPEEYSRGVSETLGRGTPATAPNYATAHHEISIWWYSGAFLAIGAGLALIATAF